MIHYILYFMIYFFTITLSPSNIRCFLASFYMMEKTITPPVRWLPDHLPREVSTPPPFGHLPYQGGVDYVSYNRGYIEYAQQNRKNPTKAEYIFRWCVIKSKKTLGYKFIRQKVVWSFILDFYCPKLMLWIELDGGYHKDRADYDISRDAQIYKKWIRVIRFTNKDIEKNLTGVVRELENIIRERIALLKKNSPKGVITFPW